MKRVLIALSSFVIPQVAFAQFDSLGLYTKWSEGVLSIADDQPLTGYIQHNDKLGLVKFKEGLDGEEQYFIDTRVRTMEYFDQHQVRYRKFAAFAVNIGQIGWTGTMLFEIMYEFKDFAVLIRYDKVNLVRRDRHTTFNNIGYEQVERICIIDTKGKLEQLLVTREFNSIPSKEFLPKKKIEHTFNLVLMKRSMERKWRLINAYIKANKLDMNIKADLLKAVDHYGALEKEEFQY